MSDDNSNNWQWVGITLMGTAYLTLIGYTCYRIHQYNQQNNRPLDFERCLHWLQFTTPTTGPPHYHPLPTTDVNNNDDDTIINSDDFEFEIV